MPHVGRREAYRVFAPIGIEKVRTIMMLPSRSLAARPADAAALLDDLEEALFEVSWLGQKQFATHLAPHGLTVPQYLTLLFVSTNEVGATMSSLAHHSLATMTGFVDRLVEQQLVERRSNAEDRRKVLVALTDKGRAQLTGARIARRQHLEHAVGQLDEAGRQDLVRLLRQFADALGVHPPAVPPQETPRG